MIGSLEILESGVAFPEQTASWGDRIMQAPKSQISPVPFRIERELPNLPSEKCPERGA